MKLKILMKIVRLTVSVMVVNYNFRITYIMADINIGIFGADMFIGL